MSDGADEHGTMGADRLSALDRARTPIRIMVVSCLACSLLAGLAGAGPLAIFYALFLGLVSFLSLQVLLSVKPHLSLRRILEKDRAFENDVAHMRFELRNDSPLPIFYAIIDDRFAPSNRTRVRSAVTRPFAKQSHLDMNISYTCKSRRGRFIIGPASLQIHDPLGLWSRPISDLEATPFYVYPAPAQLPDVPILAEAIPNSFGTLQNSRVGVSQDFAGIREYTEWDDTRHIHWAATARLGKLVVREFHQCGAPQLTIFFDLSRTSLCGIGRHATTEYAIRLVSTIVTQTLQKDYRLQLLAHGQSRLFLPFASGNGHLAEIMQALTGVQANGELPLYDLVREQVDAVPCGSGVIIIFSKCDINVDRYVEAIRVFQSRGTQVTAIIIDHTTFEAMDVPHAYHATDQAHQILTRQGVPVFYIRRGDDLGTALGIPIAIGAGP